MSEPAPLSENASGIQGCQMLQNWIPKPLSHFSSNQADVSPRIYADGVYDLFHIGHAKQFRQVKQMFPNSYLIVGVCSDEDVIKFKGTRPVMTETERCEIVRQCRYVDEVFKNPPFYPTMKFADLVAHDAIPYTNSETEDCYACFKQSDRFLTTHRTPAVSTTELLTRIFDNLELFQNREKIRKNLFL